MITSRPVSVWRVRIELNVDRVAGVARRAPGEPAPALARCRGRRCATGAAGACRATTVPRTHVAARAASHGATADPDAHRGRRQQRRCQCRSRHRLTQGGARADAAAARGIMPRVSPSAVRALIRCRCTGCGVGRFSRSHRWRFVCCTSGLGPIGVGVVKQVAGRKGLTIVGAVDIDPAKVGKDLGEVAGCRPHAARAR